MQEIIEQQPSVGISQQVQRISVSDIGFNIGI